MMIPNIRFCFASEYNDNMEDNNFADVFHPLLHLPHLPMQQDVIGSTLIPANQSVEDVFLVDPENQIEEDIGDDEEYGGGDVNDEFD
ncbi:unnamed protein product [Cochlearia groenlandica]